MKESVSLQTPIPLVLDLRDKPRVGGLWSDLIHACTRRFPNLWEKKAFRRLVQDVTWHQWEVLFKGIPLVLWLPNQPTTPPSGVRLLAVEERSRRGLELPEIQP